MATVIGGELLGQVRALLKDGTQTSEFRLVALSVAALGFGAWLEMSGSVISWFWPVSGAIIVAAYCLSRGQLKAGAGEAIVEAKAAATAPTIAERGRALPIVALLALFVAACQPTGDRPATPMQDPRAVMAQSCEAYASTLEGLARMKVAGELSTEAVARVDALRLQIGPICETQPADAAPFIEALSRGVNELLLIQINQGVQ